MKNWKDNAQLASERLAHGINRGRHYKRVTHYIIRQVIKESKKIPVLLIGNVFDDKKKGEIWMLDQYLIIRSSHLVG